MRSVKGEMRECVEGGECGACRMWRGSVEGGGWAH